MKRSQQLISNESASCGSSPSWGLTFPPAKRSRLCGAGRRLAGKDRTLEWTSGDLSHILVIKSLKLITKFVYLMGKESSMCRGFWCVTFQLKLKRFWRAQERNCSQSLEKEDKSINRRISTTLENTRWARSNVLIQNIWGFKDENQPGSPKQMIKREYYIVLIASLSHYFEADLAQNGLFMWHFWHHISYISKSKVWLKNVCFWM